MGRHDIPRDGLGLPAGGRVPGRPLPARQLPAGGLYLPGDDPTYGHRQRAFLDPFPAWNPELFDILEAGTVTVTANTTARIVRASVARGCVAFFSGFGQYGDCQAFEEVSWQIRIGERVWLTIPAIAQVGSFDRPLPLHLPVLGGNEVSVYATAGVNDRELSAVLFGVGKPQDTSAPEGA